jgi:hypothetical protein
MWRSQADAEGLTLLKADNTTGYFGVALRSPGRPKPYHAQVRRGGKMVYLGCFATAEEAALCIARSPEGQAAAKKAAAPPLTSEEARQQARAEGLTLVKAGNKTGYLGVYLSQPGMPKPYQAQVRRGGKLVYLGSFATAGEAALCVARSPEGQEAAAKRPAAPPPLTSEEVGRRGARSLRDKELLGRCEHVLTAPGARSAEEEAEEAAAEEEAEIVLVEAVEVVGEEEAGEADAVLVEVDVVEVCDVMEAEEAEAEAEDVQQIEGVEVVEVAEGRPKRRRSA